MTRRRRTHLFVATAPFGELSFARKIARDLQARGDRAVVVAPRAAASYFAGEPIRFVPFTGPPRRLDHLVLRVFRSERCDSVVLADAATVYSHLAATRLNPDFLGSLDGPTIALDTWNLLKTGLSLDYGPYRARLPRRSLELARRLIPVPFVRPTRQRGVFNAMPQLSPPSRRERLRLRTELGLGDRDRLLLITTSTWQLPESQPIDCFARSARLLPELVAQLLARVSPRLLVLHVGPRPDAPLRRVLKGRYQWHARLPPAAFAKIVAAADLLLTFNGSSTVIASAIAVGLPVLVGRSSLDCRTSREALESLAEPPSPVLRRWLARAVPFYRFRLWPVGLFRFFARVLAKNPYRGTFKQAEILKEERFVSSCRSLLFEPKAADALRERQAAYRELIRPLPGPADWIEQYLA